MSKTIFGTAASSFGIVYSVAEMTSQMGQSDFELFVAGYPFSGAAALCKQLQAWSRMASSALMAFESFRANPLVIQVTQNFSAVL